LKSRPSAALGVLNQEHHEKSYNGSHGNKDKLPRITKVEERTGHRPAGDEENGGDERAGMTRQVFSLFRYTIEMINECEWGSGVVAMLRYNHLSLLPPF
jgi:hypothetical protein